MCVHAKTACSAHTHLWRRAAYMEGYTTRNMSVRAHNTDTPLGSCRLEGGGHWSCHYLVYYYLRATQLTRVLWRFDKWNHFLQNKKSKIRLRKGRRWNIKRESAKFSCWSTVTLLETLQKDDKKKTKTTFLAFKKRVNVSLEGFNTGSTHTHIHTHTHTHTHCA